MKRIILTCVALLLSGQALADGYANVNTQIETSTYAAEQYKTASARLDEAHQNALKRTASTQRDLLKEAQISWVTLRDAGCALINSNAKSDSVQTMISNQYLTDEINEREAFLASLLQCEEGDLGCPLPPAS